jgi:hypothetical protein
MHSLHDVYEVNTYRADHVCPLSVFYLKYCWMDFDEIWYGDYATGENPKLLLLNILLLVISPWQVHKLVRWL